MKKSAFLAIILALSGLMAGSAAFGEMPGMGYTPGGGVELPHSDLSGPTTTPIFIRDPIVRPGDIAREPIPGFDPGAFIDTDGDGKVDRSDNCPTVANPDQLDSNSNGVGDACDDSDGDGVLDPIDNCVNIANADQADVNEDGKGDACQDSDFDGYSDDVDNCPFRYNTRQVDRDGDGIGDDCDNCKMVPNHDQIESETPGIGEACKTDWDNDGVPDVDDNCMLKPNYDQADLDEDGVGDACDPTCDGANCPSTTVVETDEDAPQNFGGGCSIVNVAGNSGTIFGMILMIMAAISIVRIRKAD